MTVEDLIKDLQQYDPKAIVFSWDGYDSEEVTGTGDAEGPVKGVKIFTD
jgi:hypothetical protein